jgi:8-oxo-dGTP pyrophosphatase MutT (NUDIX family)
MGAGAGGAARPITVERVRSRFAGYTPPPAPPLQPGGRAAAVLLPVFEEDGDARIVLTRRPETMPSHRGEIAFPGGKVEPAVDRDSRDAALREAHEEIGLRPEIVDVIATLPTLGTVIGQFNITPFVGIIDGRPIVTADSREVDRVFDVSLSELLSDDVYHEERWSWGLDGAERAMQFYDLADETVWGATARILTGFLAQIVGVEVTGDWGDWTRA